MAGWESWIEVVMALQSVMTIGVENPIQGRWK